MIQCNPFLKRKNIFMINLAIHKHVFYETLKLEENYFVRFYIYVFTSNEISIF